MAEAEVKSESLGYPMPGDVLDERYRLDEIINAGGMGVIMRARQLAMERDVAVKLLLPDRSERESTRTRFMREIHLAKQLTHPNTIRLYDYGKHGDFLYLVMELLSGKDLKAVLNDEGPLPIGRALDILVQAADAVSEAHGRNIVHRDLKPGNLFVQRLGSNRDFVKVLDFGIAKSLDSGTFDVTSTGEVSGTVAYLSPEMVRGKRPDKRADVYAMGVLFMEMITGRKIFEGTTVAETLMNQMQKPPVIPISLAHTPLAEVVERALTKDPDVRYQDASELLTALNAVVATVPATLKLTASEIHATYGPRPGEDEWSAPDDTDLRPRSTQIGYAMPLEQSETVKVRTDEELGELPALVGRPAQAGRRRSRVGLWVVLAAGVVGLVVVLSVVVSPREPTSSTPEPALEAPRTVVVDPSDVGVAAMVLDVSLVAQEPEPAPIHAARDALAIALDLAIGVAALDGAEREVADAEAERAPPTPRRKTTKKVEKAGKKVEKAEKKPSESDSLNVFGALTTSTKTDDPAPTPRLSPAELRAAANKAFLAGDYRGCIASCKEALAGGETSCHSLLANAYRQVGDDEAACRHYKAAGIAHKSCITLQSR